MTNAQFSLAIGLPLLTQVALFLFLRREMQIRFAAVNQRLDDLRDLWRAELHRVEGVLDARLKALEETRR